MAVWAAGPVPVPAAGQAICVSDFISLGHGSHEGCRESWLSADLGTHRASTQLLREWGAAVGACPAHRSLHSPACKHQPSRQRERALSLGCRTAPHQAPFLSPQGSLLSHKESKSLYQAGICIGNRGLGEAKPEGPWDHRAQCLHLGGDEPQPGTVERAWGASSCGAQD